MPKPVEYRFHFQLPIIGGRFGVIFTDDIEDSYQRLGGDEDVTNSLAVCVYRKGKWWSVLPIDVDGLTMTHEAAHLTFFALNRVGIEIQDGEANEMYCYTLEYILSKITGFRNRAIKLEEERSDNA